VSDILAATVALAAATSAIRSAAASYSSVFTIPNTLVLAFLINENNHIMCCLSCFVYEIVSYEILLSKRIVVLCLWTKTIKYHKVMRNCAFRGKKETAQTN
ncbi:MAG: hypothetical protein ACI81G_001353, partial [Gammaproteobacteria bacterium]